nr:hypothetical protein [Microcella alkaliphila]
MLWHFLAWLIANVEDATGGGRLDIDGRLCRLEDDQDIASTHVISDFHAPLDDDGVFARIAGGGHSHIDSHKVSAQTIAMRSFERA